MTVAVNDIVRITCVFGLFTNDEATNNYYFKVTTQGEATDTLFMDKVAAHMDRAYTLINSKISTNVTYVNIVGQNITQDVLLPTKLWPVLVAGGDAGEALPTQVTALVFFRTLRPKTRAAIYMPPLTEVSQNAGGAILAAALTQLQSFGDDQVDGIKEITVEADYGAFNPTLVRFTPVNAAIVPTRFRTQRRRRLGVGS